MLGGSESLILEGIIYFKNSNAGFVLFFQTLIVCPSRSAWGSVAPLLFISGLLHLSSEADMPGTTLKLIICYVIHALTNIRLEQCTLYEASSENHPELVPNVASVLLSVIRYRDCNIFRDHIHDCFEGQAMLTHLFQDKNQSAAAKF